MIPISKYRLEEQGGLFFVVTLEVSYCPICQGLVFTRGTRRRILYKSEEHKLILVIRRLYCEKCKCIHHELPDCIVPYKRYSAEVIENIIESPTEPAPCPSGTVRRILSWWAAVVPYFLCILQTLVQKLNVSFGKPPAFKEIVRAAASSSNWIFAHQLCTRSASRPE